MPRRGNPIGQYREMLHVLTRTSDFQRRSIGSIGRDFFQIEVHRIGTNMSHSGNYDSRLADDG
jgi:hypothetical protein